LVGADPIFYFSGMKRNLNLAFDAQMMPISHQNNGKQTETPACPASP